VRRSQTELLILQPTPFCNLDCSYCYLPDRSNRARMSHELVDAVGRLALARGRPARQTTVVWHAGEPMVLPARWYADAFAILERHRPAGVELVHSFQTNATLIDRDWLGLLARDDVRVGVSLDGPQALHDRHRTGRGGAGSHERAMAGVAALQEAGIAFHVICVLTAASLERPEELAEFFLGHGLTSLCFNVEEADGIHAVSSLDDRGIEERYAAFLHRFLAVVERSPRRVWIREIQYCEEAVRHRPLRRFASNHQIEPLAILSVDAAGRVSTFSPELMGVPAADYDDFLFARVEDLERPDDLLRRPAFRRAAAAIEAGRRACRARCEYFRWCGGGAPANKLGETGRLDTAETLFCRLTVKTLLDSYLERTLSARQAS